MRIAPFPNHLKNIENRENMVIDDMEEAHLSHDRERRRWKIAEETNEERLHVIEKGSVKREETNEEREVRSVVEEKARRALAR